MTLGLRCAHVSRTPKLKPCRFGCGVLVPTKCAAKACEDCAVKHCGGSKTALDPKYRDLTRAEIDRAFTQALAEIRRRPRAEPELRWRSTLSGWTL